MKQVKDIHKKKVKHYEIEYIHYCENPYKSRILYVHRALKIGDKYLFKHKGRWHFEELMFI